jgi:hypothetical protein
MGVMVMIVRFVGFLIAGVAIRRELLSPVDTGQPQIDSRLVFRCQRFCVRPQSTSSASTLDSSVASAFRISLVSRS